LKIFLSALINAKERRKPSPDNFFSIKFYIRIEIRRLPGRTGGEQELVRRANRKAPAAFSEEIPVLLFLEIRRLSEVEFKPDRIKTQSRSGVACRRVYLNRNLA
jgi:hypothetical protein